MRCYINLYVTLVLDVLSEVSSSRWCITGFQFTVWKILQSYNSIFLCGVYNSQYNLILVCLVLRWLKTWQQNLAMGLSQSPQNLMDKVEVWLMNWMVLEWSNSLISFCSGSDAWELQPWDNLTMVLSWPGLEQEAVTFANGNY